MSKEKKKKWILVVESDAQIRDRLTRALRPHRENGIGVWVMETGTAAVESCGVNGSPLLVICGLQLKGPMTGVDLANSLNEGSSPPQILFYSGADGELAVEAQRLVDSGQVVCLFSKKNKQDWAQLLKAARKIVLEKK